MMNFTFWTLVAIVIGYLLGSIPTSVILAKLAKLPDPRTLGSKNPGTTNMLRVSGKKWALFTLIGDMAKGAAAVLVGYLFIQHGFWVAVIGLAAYVGHVYSVFLKFKGGKGVATGFGVMLALNPLLGIAAIITWAVIAFIFKYSSLAALVAYSLAPFYSIYFFWSFKDFVPLLLITALIFWRHKDNIQRLREGTETKVGKAGFNAETAEVFMKAMEDEIPESTEESSAQTTSSEEHEQKITLEEANEEENKE